MLHTTHQIPVLDITSIGRKTADTNTSDANTSVHIYYGHDCKSYGI